MLEITNLKLNNTEVSYEEQTAVKGAAKGFAGGFLGSLAGSAYDAYSTGSFGYSAFGKAATTGLAVGTIGAAFGGPIGAALSE